MRAGRLGPAAALCWVVVGATHALGAELLLDAGVPAMPLDGGAKYEWAALPIIDGNTDIGVAMGAFGQLSRLAPSWSTAPYQWKLELGAMFSVKEKPGGGVELPVHDDWAQFDWRSLDGRWKWISDLWYWRSAVAGFYGLGNLSPMGGDLRSTTLRTTQYVRTEFVVQSSLAWELVKSLSLRACLEGERVAALAYEGSTLDLARAEEPLVFGLSPHVSLIGTAGLEYDTRDNETATNRGVYLSASLRGSPGPLTGTDYTFGGINFHARGYYDVWPGRVVLVARVLFDGVFGRPPLQELSRSGGFDAVWMMGGSDGARGIPEGRYQGRLRLTANVEARVNVITFTLFDTPITLGAVVFGDGGRVWADWQPRPELDGTGLGLHLAAGAGLRLRIGDTVLFRFDAAWSPPPVNPADDAFGLYVDSGHIF